MNTLKSGKIDLSGQVAIVTGASRGIGKAVAISLAREGAEVIASDILPVDDTIESIRTLGSKAIGVTCDITNQEEVDNMVGLAEKEFGKIDILVTCAGLCERTSSDDISHMEWDKVMDVNLKGTFLCCQAVYPKMKANNYGKIVTIGSIAGKVGGVISGPHYVASKGGVHAMVKWFAKDGATHNVFVNSVAPGPVYTDMTSGFPYSDSMAPLQRLGEPEDIAEAVLFLSSQASNWITGITLDVNGGMLMS
ncbi:SDR family NAD(P)-dependent oxidoreductase [Pseudalkalibacillus decolorationis]|uniref:SDR family NAD(P)-dependent oxidoreductase n=1 Tax=Pseudalkalibacillus decolorationis TaxID=163879 RepID=UPI00214915FF|nr:3-oxoacyl-ACP reductase family protein [Pseudalkalibacillus decolorationis]